MTLQLLKKLLVNKKININAVASIVENKDLIHDLWEDDGIIADIYGEEAKKIDIENDEGVLGATMSAGVCCQAIRTKGISVLHIAAMFNRSEIAKILLLSGANLQAKDSNGKTAIDVAEEQGHDELYNLLTDDDLVKNLASLSMIEKNETSVIANTAIDKSIKNEVLNQLIEDDVIIGEDEIPEDVQKESLELAQKKGSVGPSFLPGWKLQDVGRIGNCFYEAIVDQMWVVEHEFLYQVPSGTEPHDSLRLHVQGENFKDKEYATDKEIQVLVEKLDVIIAVADTRYPPHIYTYKYKNALGEFEEGQDVTKLPQGKYLFKIVFTGNHYLSVRSDPHNIILKPEIKGKKIIDFSYKTPTKINLLLKPREAGEDVKGTLKTPVIHDDVKKKDAMQNKKK